MSAWASIGGVLVALAMLTSTAQAQQNCAPRQEVVDGLSKHGERVVQRGIVGKHLLEVWVSSDGGFTIVVTSPEKITCLIATGNSMHEVLPGIKL
tara:strand:- start:860 stop:1144 length:285 start_codon:yes stop_codon:yes gene_type:complete